MALLVGTASWTDKTLIDSKKFYPPGVKTPEGRLRFYATQFPLVEVDSSYYAIPSEANSRLWVERTPAGFTFNVKAFRLFTGHATEAKALPRDLQAAMASTPRFVYRDTPAELKNELWIRFAYALWPLREAGKLGMIHFQFGPNVRHAPASVAHIEECVRRLSGHVLSVEFRHRSWWADADRTTRTLAWLRDLGVVHTIVDGPQGAANSVPAVWETTHPEYALLRLHGRNIEAYNALHVAAADRFDYAYTTAELGELAARYAPIAKSVKYAHAVFNNCMEDKAQLNAKEFLALLT